MPGKAEVKAKRRLLVQALRAIAVSCKVAAVRDDARRKSSLGDRKHDENTRNKSEPPSGTGLTQTGTYSGSDLLGATFV